MKAYDPFDDSRRSWTLSEAAEAYLKSRRKAGCTEHTLEELERFLPFFCEELGGDRPLRSLPKEDIEAFYLRESLKRSSQASYYRRLRALLNWCAEQGAYEKEEVHKLEKPRPSKAAPLFLSEEEADKLQKYFQADEDHRWMEPVFLLALYTGLRLSPLRRLTWERVQLEAGFIHVEGKGHRERYVPIFPATRRVLERLSPTSDYVLTAPWRDDIPYDYTSKAFKKAVRAMRLDEGYRFHTLRHTFASWLAMEGVPLRMIQAWMGHASITTTERYAHLRPRTSSKAAAAVFS